MIPAYKYSTVKILWPLPNDYKGVPYEDIYVVAVCNNHKIEPDILIANDVAEMILESPMEVGLYSFYLNRKNENGKVIAQQQAKDFIFVTDVQKEACNKHGETIALMVTTKDCKPTKLITLDMLAPDVITRLGETHYILGDNKGTWQEEPMEPYKANDIVYHLGCAWLCVKDDTTEEPTWYTEDWVYLMGDNAFSIDIDSSAGRMFRRGDVETTLSCKVMFGSFDVTQKVLSRGSVGIEWKRDTGNEVLDNAWRPYMTIPDDQTSINLRVTNFDVGYDFFDRGKTIFTLDMQIPTSDGYYNLTRTINIKV